MFEEVKHQIKAYLPENLSPIATALIVGGVALIIGFLLFSLEIYYPGFVHILPESLFNIIVLSAATLLSGFVIWVFKVKKDITDSSSNPINKSENEEDEDFYNYSVKENNVSYSVLNNHSAIYEDERLFVVEGDVRYPASILYEPLMKGVKIRLIDCSGFKPYKESIKDLKKWRHEIFLETDFLGPIQKGSTHRSWVKIELKGKNVPQHLYSASRYPIKGPMNFKVDLHRSRFRPRHVKLLSFVSYKATKPILPSSSSPTEEFNRDNIVKWTIEKPKTEYLYVLTWKEPCYCSWCESINFN